MSFPVQRQGCFALLVILLLSSGCQAAPAQLAPAATVVAQQPSIAPAATVPATATARPTATPAPTATPTATPTAIPTSTPAPTATPQPTGPGGLAFPLKTAELHFGVAAHLFYTIATRRSKPRDEAGFGWVRQQIHWRDQEGPAGNYPWGELDDIVAAVNAHGLKLLISIVRSPPSTPPMVAMAYRTTRRAWATLWPR